MKTLPENISLLDAASLLTLPVGIIARDLRVPCETGNEPVSTSRLMRQYKIPLPIFQKLHAGTDKLISRAEAAAMLGVRPHCLNFIRVSRPMIVPAVVVSKAPWGGPRYLLSAVKAQLQLDQMTPPPHYTQKARAPHCPAQPVYQPLPAP